MISSQYLFQMIDLPCVRKNIPRLIDRARQINNGIRSGRRFNGLVGTGVSGTLVLVPMALALDMPFAVVRKPNENCHSRYSVEGDLRISRYLFVDDFIFGGDTFRTVIEEMKQWNKSKPAAGLLYRADYPLSHFNHLRFKVPMFSTTGY